MTTGKALVQSLHAALGVIKQIDKKIVKKWENEGTKKVVLKANLNELKEIVEKLKKEKIFYFLVKDAGLTQLKPGTITALGIGPIEEDKIDKITGKLKLF
jgi:PTH2 family peptidyl-tRNA hydrolase